MGGGLFGVLPAAATLLFGKKPKAAAPALGPRRDLAAEEARKRDVIGKRRGVATNLILGATGAESSAGGKTQLGA
jgi:hypothetical protein